MHWKGWIFDDHVEIIKMETRTWQEVRWLIPLSLAEGIWTSHFSFTNYLDQRFQDEILRVLRSLMYFPSGVEMILSLKISNFCSKGEDYFTPYGSCPVMS